MENWKTIIEVTNYEVSDFGRIRNSQTGKILKGRLSKSGYLQVSLHIIKTDKFQNCYIHRLVAQYFLDNPENKREVNHIDGDKLNNNIKNLEWMTSSENQIHKHLMLGKTKTSQRRIGQYDLHHNLIKEWDSIIEAVSQFSTNRSNIDAALQKRQATAYGYIWEYLN